MLKERYRPKGALEGLGRWLAGAALWPVVRGAVCKHFLGRLRVDALC